MGCERPGAFRLGDALELGAVRQNDDAVRHALVAAELVALPDDSFKVLHGTDAVVPVRAVADSIRQGAEVAGQGREAGRHQKRVRSGSPVQRPEIPRMERPRIVGRPLATRPEGSRIVDQKGADLAHLVATIQLHQIVGGEHIGKRPVVTGRFP